MVTYTSRQSHKVQGTQRKTVTLFCQTQAGGWGKNDRGNRFSLFFTQICTSKNIQYMAGNCSFLKLLRNHKQNY